MQTKSRFPIFATALLFSLGAWIRCFRLGRQSLWFDEILTVHDASFPFRQIHRIVLASPPLYHYLIHFLLRFGAHSDGALRIPSAVFGVCAVPIFFYATREALGAKAAYWGTLFLVLSPFHVLFSQELRMYSALFLVSLLALWSWHRAWELQTPKAWAVYAAVSATGLYLHNWFAFLFFTQFVYFVLVERKRLLRAGAAFGAAALAWSPWLPFIWRQAHRPIYEFLPRPDLMALWHTMHAMSGVSVPCGALSLTLPTAWIPLANGSAVVLFLAGLWKQRERAFIQRVACAGFLGPIGLAFIFSKCGPASFYHPGRYTILALPAFLWGCAAAFAPARTENALDCRLAVFILSVLAAAWMGFCSWQLVAYFTVQEKAPWRWAAQTFHEHPEALADFLRSAGPVERMSVLYYLDKSSAPDLSG
jgi:uncharacterized membrane protein